MLHSSAPVFNKHPPLWVPQAAALAAKHGVVAVIDELEKLSKLVGEAIDEEVLAACNKAREQALEEGED